MEIVRARQGGVVQRARGAGETIAPQRWSVVVDKKSTFKLVSSIMLRTEGFVGWWNYITNVVKL
jgi:hypothetical protein